MKTWVVLPTFNEAANLPKITAALMELPVPELSVLVVDDDSPDGTGGLADELREKYAPRVQVLHRKGRRGLGTAYIEGFHHVLASGADHIIQMDADFSHSPDYIPLFLQHIGEQDVIVGSRYVPGGKLDERWSRWRYLLSWWANGVYVRTILGLRVRDATGGFKLFRRRVLEALNLESIRSNGYVFQVEVAYLCEKNGFRILEWPIYFEDRRIGESKMSILVKLEAAMRVWQIRHRYGSVAPNAARVDFQRETA